MKRRKLREGARRIRILETTRKPGEVLLRACAMFGLGTRRRVRKQCAANESLTQCALEILQVAKSHVIVLVTGPSGAGKSTVLRELARLRRAVTSDVAMEWLRRSGSAMTIIEVLPGTLEERLELLGRVGLGDATLLARSFGELSDGQRHRFMIAWMLKRARRDGTRLVIADEFTSTLDRVTAMSVARSLRKWFDRTRSRAVLVVATAHCDVEQWLKPDVCVHIGLDGTWRLVRADAEGASDS